MKDNVLLPRKLTAEAKYALSGEFVEQCNYPCPECYMDEESDCEPCGGNGMIDMDVTVSWMTIKKIYDRIVSVFGKETRNP